MNVLIIGGSSDIGINLAIKFRDTGNNVCITYNNNSVDIDGIKSYKCNIKYESCIEDVIKKCNKVFNNNYILINLASISLDNNFFSKTKEEFMEVLEVNLVGMFLCNKIYSKYHDNGLIINMSSTDGIDTYSEYSLDYSASKAGIINMSRNINHFSTNKVICICPNWIDSDSTRNIDKEYLTCELKRISQSRLITMSEIVDSIYNIVIDNFNNTDEDSLIYRIDIRKDKLWIERI